MGVGSPRGAEAACLAALVLLAVAVTAWRWVGYQGHDDVSYAQAALDWVNHFPPLARDHWSLRYTLVLPIAGVIALTGPSIAALALPNLVAYAGFLAVSYWAGRRWFGWPAGALLVLVGVLLPQFPVQATYANPDLLEMAFVMASFWLFLLGRERGGDWRPLLASGVLAGFGFLTRETTLSLLVTYGLFFLARPGMGRLRYVVMGLGFVVVVGAQSAYFAVRTGDPLYRTRISASHDTVDRGAKEEAANAAGNAVDSEGVLATKAWLAPFAAVFVSQKYGLLFVLAIPAYALLRLGAVPGLTRRQLAVVDCTGFGALVSFAFVAANAEILYIVPRYFMVAAAMAAVPVAVLGAGWLALGGYRRALAALGGAGFAVTALMLLYLENTRTVAEDSVMAYLPHAPGVVHIDPELERRLRYKLMVAGLEQRVTTAPPGPGDLVAAAQDGYTRSCAEAPSCPYRDVQRPFVPQPGWTEVEHFDPPLRSIARLGLGRAMPPDLRRKVEQPGFAAVVYKLPG